MSLKDTIKSFVLDKGAVAAGITNKDRLEGGPPSADLDFILEGARSALSFAMPLNQEAIRAFFAKENHDWCSSDMIEANMKVTQIGNQLRDMLGQEGIESQRVHANLVYRKNTTPTLMHPDIGHRYMAVTSGVGRYGWSSNVLVPGYGATTILGTVVIKADMEADPYCEEDMCDNCKLCVSSCAASMMSMKEEETVSLGGKDFTFSKKSNCLRCGLVCGGLTGLSKNRKWSTWSPGRFEIPDDDNKLFEVYGKAMQAAGKRKTTGGGIKHPAMGTQFKGTCGNCANICFADKEDRKENWKLLTTSGVVVQFEDGPKVVRAEEAEKLEAEGKILQ